MTEKIVPMIHVPDVAVTAQWYESIGFTTERVFMEGDEKAANWALLRFGDSTVMLNSGGKSSGAPRRECDLYIHVDNVETLCQRLKGKADLVEDLHDTFYGMSEFIIRDCNGFWITFGQPISK